MKKNFAKAEMFIRKDVAEMFQAMVDAAITTKIWFTALIAEVRDSTEGFTLVLANLKALMEFNILLNLVEIGSRKCRQRENRVYNEDCFRRYDFRIR